MKYVLLFLALPLCSTGSQEPDLAPFIELKRTHQAVLLDVAKSMQDATVQCEERESRAGCYPPELVRPLFNAFNGTSDRPFVAFDGPIVIFIESAPSAARPGYGGLLIAFDRDGRLLDREGIQQSCEAPELPNPPCLVLFSRPAQSFEWGNAGDGWYAFAHVTDD